jgi:hypothetical protein
MNGKPTALFRIMLWDEAIGIAVTTGTCAFSGAKTVMAKRRPLACD